MMPEIIHVIPGPENLDIVSAAAEIYLSIVKHNTMTQTFVFMKNESCGYSDVPVEYLNADQIASRCSMGTVVLLHKTPFCHPDISKVWYSKCPVICVQHRYIGSIVENRYRNMDMIVCPNLEMSVAVGKYTTLPIQIIKNVCVGRSSSSRDGEELVIGAFLDYVRPDFLNWLSSMDFPVPVTFEVIGEHRPYKETKNRIEFVNVREPERRAEVISNWTACLYEGDSKENTPWGIIECAGNNVPILCNDRSQLKHVVSDGINGFIYSSRSEVYSFLTDICIDPSILDSLRERVSTESDDRYGDIRMSDAYALISNEASQDRPMIRKRIRNQNVVSDQVVVRTRSVMSKRHEIETEVKEPLPMYFTSTAMARPEILDRTLKSFTSNLTGIKYKESTLYINVDPVPEGKDREEVVNVAKEYFGTVVSNLPSRPNFTEAVRWCWNNPRCEYFFHLEDDWILEKQINVHDLIKMMKAKRNCAVVNLRAYSHINDGRICLSPCLVNTVWARQVALNLDWNYNPERQLRRKTRLNSCGGKSPYGYSSIQFPTNPNATVLTDIGREWIKTSEYIRPDGNDFVVWRKK